MTRNDCAVCRAPISHARNFFAEVLLYKLYQRCTYESLGCAHRTPSAQMRLHEATCEFAPFECPYTECRQLVGPGELLDHLKSHQIPVTEGTIFSAQIDIPKNYPTNESVCALPHILMKYDISFLPVIARNPDGTWSFFVTTQDHKDYRYEITVT
jgi:hypothetical protein